MSELSGFTTLKSIVANVISDQGDAADMGQWKRYVRWGARGFKQLRMFVMPHAKEVKVTVDTDIYAITLPEDFVSLVGVGIPYKGKFFPISYNNDLIATTTESCGAETQSSANGENVSQTPANMYYVYGQGGGINQYYYKPDLLNNRILINGSPVLTTVILKYVSTGINIGEETLIPIVAEEALIAFIHWQEALNSPTPDQRYAKSNIAMEELRKREWMIAFNNLKYITNMPSLQTLYDAVNEASKQVIKR